MSSASRSTRGSQSLSRRLGRVELGKLAARGMDAMERTVESPARSLWLLTGLMGLTLGAHAVSAGARPFWFDELFTVMLAQLPSMEKVREVLETGADAMPLFYYWLEKQAGRLPLDPHVAFRLPSVAGYLLATAGVYLFTRRLLNPAAGMIAALVLALSPFREYALEARPYALMVGCLAGAAALWQRVEENRAYPLLMGLALGLGMACHHYTVVALSCFGLAEACVLWSKRRWRWRVWIPLAASTIPFWIGLPLLLRFRELAGPYYWAKPHWTGVTSTYSWSGLSLALFVSVLWGSIPAWTKWLQRSRRNESKGGAGRTAVAAEVVLTVSLLLFPLTLLLMARLFGGGYTLRYNLPFILGFAILCGLLARLYMRPRAAAWVAAALCLSLVVRDAFEAGRNRHGDAWGVYQPVLHNLAQTAKTMEPELPVVYASLSQWLALNFYGDRASMKRVLALADLESSRHYTGRDTVPLAMLGLRRTIPVGIRDSKEFLASHPRFYVWMGPDHPHWLLHSLKLRGYRLSVVMVAGKEDLVFLAEYLGDREKAQAGVDFLEKPEAAK